MGKEKNEFTVMFVYKYVLFIFCNQWWLKCCVFFFFNCSVLYPPLHWVVEWWLGLLCFAEHSLACKCMSVLCMVEHGRVHQGFLIRSSGGWTGVVFQLNWFVLTDHILYEKKATNISLDANTIVGIRKHAQRKTLIYACNNISNWLLRISSPLYKNSWTLNITRSKLWEEAAWK